MGFIQDNILLVVGVLSALVFLEGLIIYVQQKRQPNKRGSHKSGSSGSVSKEKYENDKKAWKSDIRKLENDCKQKDEELKKESAKLKKEQENYEKTCKQNTELRLTIVKHEHTITEQEHTIDKLKENKTSLEQQVSELKRDKDELTELLKKDSAPNVTEAPQTAVSTQNQHESEIKADSVDNAPSASSPSPAQEIASSEVVQEPNEESKEESKLDSAIDPKSESPKEMTMYASFPRSADSSIYFSDLSENRVDDSYFELKVNIASGKASFRPLDFMKIRNYDPAMAAMLTEGIKPNVASTVLGIEPGKAHIEGKDWIIDNPAKIKLA